MPKRKLLQTLEEFFDSVDKKHAAMRAAGLVNVYVQHDTLTPGNVRATFEDTPVDSVPKEGAILDLPYAGYDGSPARWRVARVEQLKGPGVILHCQDAEDGVPASAAPPTPVHDKLAADSDRLDAVGEFLDWLSDQGYEICVPRENLGYMWCGKRRDTLLAEFGEIDPKELEREKLAILEHHRKINGIQP